MTGQQTPANTQTPKTDVETSASRRLLHRFKYAAHRRFPRFFLYPGQLEAWRSRDSARNAETSPPKDEFIDLHCMWAVEFYTPAHVDDLLSGLRKLGRDNEHPFDIGTSPTSWIQELRQRSYGGRLNLGVIQCLPETATLFVPGLRTKPLPPPQVQYVTCKLYSLTSSLTCVVIGFVFEKDFSTQFNKALRTERQTYIKSHTIYDPERQKIDHIRQVRADMTELAGRWFCENLPRTLFVGYSRGSPADLRVRYIAAGRTFPATS